MPRRKTEPFLVEPAILEDAEGQFAYVLRQLWEWDPRRRAWRLAAGGEAERVRFNVAWGHPDWPMFEAIRTHAAGGPPTLHAVAYYLGTDRRWHVADEQTNY